MVNLPAGARTQERAGGGSVSGAVTSPGERYASSPRRALALAVAALASGVLLSLGGLELATRVSAIAPALPHQDTFVPDDVLPWKSSPNRDRMTRNAEFTVRVRTNNLGFRGRDHEFEKPPGVFRIVFIGDSFTYGVGAGEGATYPDRIEAALGARAGSGRVEAINLGMYRYWPEPEALMLEHYGLRYRPDLVIVGVPPNDFVDTRAGSTAVNVSRGYLVTSRAQRLGAVGRWLYLNSHVARTLIAEALARNPKAPEPGMEDDEAVWARMVDAWSRMVELARGAGAQIVFLHIPQKSPWGPQETPPRLQQLCATRECAAIDSLPTMRAHPDPDSLYYPKDGHCTEAGYALIADVVVRELDARGMLPETLRLADQSVAASIPPGGR